MAGLVPAIHVVRLGTMLEGLRGRPDVDARHEAGQDGGGGAEVRRKGAKRRSVVSQPRKGRSKNKEVLLHLKRGSGVDSADSQPNPHPNPTDTPTGNPVKHPRHGRSGHAGAVASGGPQSQIWNMLSPSVREAGLPYMTPPWQVPRESTAIQGWVP